MTPFPVWQVVPGLKYLEKTPKYLAATEHKFKFFLPKMTLGAGIYKCIRCIFYTSHQDQFQQLLHLLRVCKPERETVQYLSFKKWMSSSTLKSYLASDLGYPVPRRANHRNWIQTEKGGEVWPGACKYLSICPQFTDFMIFTRISPNQFKYLMEKEYCN